MINKVFWYRHAVLTYISRDIYRLLFVFSNILLWCRAKGSQLSAFCPYAIVHCYLEFKLRYIKNLKLFSIRPKELFEPTVLRKKGDRFLPFLKSFSLETDLWVMLGDFMVEKNANLGWEICIYLKIVSVETKCGMRQIIEIMCVTCMQRISRFKL